MSQPTWITPAGSLGTIPEGVFYQMAMLASTDIIATATCTATSASTNRITCDSTAGIYPGLNVMFGGTQGTVFGGISALVRYFVLDVYSSTEFSITASEFTTEPISLTTATGTMPADFTQHVLFNLQAGELPSGIQVSDNGLIIGTPKAVASIQGVPSPVNRDVTSKFTIRAYTQKYVSGSYVLDSIRDRTFTLTVSGPNPPVFITPAGQVGQFYDGTLATGLQIQYTDPDPGNIIVTARIASGSLPAGLSMSSTGLISGFVDLLDNDVIVADYNFSVEISDNVYNQLRAFSITVYNRSKMTASNGEVTADNTFVTADVTAIRPPIITNPEGSIGTTKNDNWFAYKFDGEDLDGDLINYELLFDIGDSSGIPGLTLDPNSGWLYGFIPSLGLTDQTYNFGVRVSKDTNPLSSNEYYYSLTITGDIRTAFTWITNNADLGTINNGDTSTFYVEGVVVSGIPLQYRLLSGSNSNLPQGLQLLPSGNIAGKVSFDTFALDLGTTTFDVTLNDLVVSGQNTETTFDMKHTFIVEAYSVNGLVSVTKEFSITVIREFNEPYDNLYVEAMPPQNDRDLIQSLLQNSDIFQPALLYRPDDPNFGRATNVTYNHAFGLKAATYEEYVSSLYENHYWKNLVLGEVNVAQARNANDEVIYEVVYSRVIDNLLNDQGQSVSKSVTLPYPVLLEDSTEISTVYPNSLIDMRDQVIDTVGQVSNVLPLWMTSKQENGKVLGFVPSWVLAYAKPGKGKQLAYYIRTQFGERLNLIDFEVDRYELDRQLSKNWDPIADSTGGAWVPTPAETTFDIYNGYLYETPSLDTTGRILATTDATGDGVTVKFGVDLLPDSGTVIVTVNDVIQEYATDFEINFGQFPNYVIFATAPAVGATVSINQIEKISVSDSTGDYGTQTTFDEQSLRFIAPVDMYSDTQVYDKYLVFPKRTILG